MELENYLQELEEQKPQEEKKIQVIGNADLDLVFKQFEKFLRIRYRMGEEVDLYNELCEDLNGVNCSAKDIALFSGMIKKYEANSNFVWLAGLFLSAVINKSKEKNFEIITSHLNEKIWLVGTKNIKNVKVKGSLGDAAGYHMKKGRLTIEGSAGNNLGFEAKGGEIYVSEGIYDLAADCGAKVYEDGELVWPR